MTIERTEVAWLEARGDYTLQELIELSGLQLSVIDGLIECGVLPVTIAEPDYRFEAETIVLARAASRLHASFELSHDGLAVAVSLLRRVRRLETLLAAARFTNR